ncbi:hypothetical protein [Jannaschia seohaensis]|uniref:Lipoprotein n=1 Tax=Jannaschia seohaensis TaxID=475081 RepID=A0A2Y9A4J9_9RHOB|nr:hypothetical protein [Jannaschia seohaensis]PWJ22090.1 hypothetical protein BCF38_101499 [Jannaschia seohaensis]SSA38368.1 hypothetical protein SAMN05421539_101499 [Jannaschia seohaensis]
MIRLLPFLALTLAACQTAEPEPEVTPEVIAIANACLAEIDRPPLPEDADASAAAVLTPEEKAAYEACIARRIAEA